MARSRRVTKYGSRFRCVARDSRRVNRLGLLGLLVLASCETEPLTLDAYPVAYLDVACDFLVRCGVTPSIESCRESRSKMRFDAELISAVDAGIVMWHGDAAEDCLARIDQLSCDRTSESYRHFGCEPMFSGTLGNGEACTTSTECISRECWTEGCTKACCVGYCAGDIKPTIGEIGDPCRLSGCVAGARCEDSVCVPLRAEGEACTYELNGECAYGLACIDKVCTSPIESGESCTIASECRMIGESCNPRGTCGPVGQLGDLCISSNHCAPHLVCGVESHCRPAPKVGERCDAFFFSECYDADAFCDEVTKMCALPKSDGAACTYSVECQSYNCFDGACVSCDTN